MTTTLLEHWELLRILATRAKADVESRVAEISAAKKTIDQLEKRVEDIESRLASAQKKENRLIEEIERLRIRVGPDEMIEGDYAKLIMLEQEVALFQSAVDAAIYRLEERDAVSNDAERAIQEVLDDNRTV